MTLQINYKLIESINTHSNDILKPRWGSTEDVYIHIKNDVYYCLEKKGGQWEVIGVSRTNPTSLTIWHENYKEKIIIKQKRKLLEILKNYKMYLNWGETSN